MLKFARFREKSGIVRYALKTEDTSKLITPEYLAFQKQNISSFCRILWKIGLKLDSEKLFSTSCILKSEKDVLMVHLSIYASVFQNILYIIS